MSGAPAHEDGSLRLEKGFQHRIILEWRDADDFASVEPRQGGRHDVLRAHLWHVRHVHVLDLVEFGLDDARATDHRTHGRAGELARQELCEHHHG